MTHSDVSPPGREEQVKALENAPNVENPYAVAWASYEGDGASDDPNDKDEFWDARACAACDQLTPLTNDGVPVAHAVVSRTRGTPSEDIARMCDGREVRGDIVRKRGGSYVLLSKKTGKVLGKHKTKAEAENQERAIQAAKHADGKVRRYDYVSELGPVESADDLDPPEVRQNGWRRLCGRIARVGIQEYVDGSGKTIRELRIPEEVFDPESMRSFAMVPVTNGHPSKLLDAGDARRHQVGSVGENLRASGDWLIAPFMLTDAGAIEALDAGRRQLSNGYDCVIDPTQDPELIAKWGPYDGIQRGIRGNHLALVDVARAGPDATPRLDAGDAVVVASLSTPQPTPEKIMPQELRIDGLTIALTDANAGAIQQSIDRAIAAASKAGQDLVAVERGKLDGVTKDSKRLAKNCEVLKGMVIRFRKRIDAAKAVMMPCDACDGKGVIGEGENAEKCDYCDGEGQFRMHDKIPETNLDPAGNEDDDPDMETDLDADELEAEQATEGEAPAAHKDGKKAARRAAKIADAKKARRDAFQKAAKQQGRARARLELAAQAILGDEKLDAKSDLEIKKACIVKADGIEPKALEGKSPEYVDGWFGRVVAAASKAGGAKVDSLRANLGGLRPPSRSDGRTGGPAEARARMIERNQKMHKAPRAGTSDAK